MLHIRKINARAFGKRVAERREQQGLSPAELGEIIGIPYATVYSWENGDVSRPGRILDLARALHTTPEWLQFGEGQSSTAVQDAAEEMLDVLRLVRDDKMANLNGVLSRSVRDVIARAEGRAR